MVILNILGRIDRTCISKKLGIYISNLPDGGETGWNNWQDGIKEDLQLSYEKNWLDAEQLVGKFESGDKNLFEERFNEAARRVLGDLKTELLKEKYIEYLSQNMICIDMDYRESNIPFGEHTYARFDWGSCEEEPIEKIMGLVSFVYSRNIGDDFKLPHAIYCTNPYGENDYHHIFSGTLEIDEQVENLKEVGSIIDSYLISEKEYYQFEYLCDALYEIEQNEKSAYHFMKVYSLCALLLEKDVESELDYKLPGLMRKDLSLEERKEQAEFMRKIRNKVAHGDFMAVNKLLERYACKFMDGRFWFDYSEYTRESWVLLHISCELEAVLKLLLKMQLESPEQLLTLKNMKAPKSMKTISYEMYMNRLLEIQRDCNHEQYMSEVIMPVLKACCIDGKKVVPVYDDRATGRKTENETPCKKRMKKICAHTDDEGYIVPDYLYVDEKYSFDNPIEPCLMIETKNPIIAKGNMYRKLKDSIPTYYSELIAEIKACGHVIYTDGITWMFLEQNDGKIFESSNYKTVCLVEPHDKKNKVYSFSQLDTTIKWQELLNTIQKLLTSKTENK